MFDNRILNAFDKMKRQIDERIQKGLTTPEKVQETHKALDLDVEEFVSFQEVKSLAVAMNKLTVDEGMTVYTALGNSPETFNKQPTHVKAVLFTLFKQLLEWKMTKPGWKPFL